MVVVDTKNKRHRWKKNTDFASLRSIDQHCARESLTWLMSASVCECKERERERERERHTHRETERQRETKRDKERQRETKRDKEKSLCRRIQDQGSSHAGNACPS